MGRIVTVAVREFVETVKTRAFLFGAILMPMLIVGLVLGVQRLSKLTEDESLPVRRVAVVDHTGVVTDELTRSIAEYNHENLKRPFALESVAPASANVDALNQRVRDGGLYAYLIVPADVIAGGATCRLGRKDSRIEVQRLFREMVNGAIVKRRFATADPPIDLEQVQRLQQRVELESVDVISGRASSGNEFAQIITPFAFLFLLFTSTFGISQGLLTSLIEEKSSRVVEVLLSAVSPLELLGGKILGMVTVGALLLAIWGVAGYAAAESNNMLYLLASERLVFMALYFVPGFLFYSSVLAAIGSACNTLKDAQSMTFPITLVTIIPMMMWLPLSQNPQSALAIVLSLIPPITPFVMILRVCADPNIPIWQVVLSLALLWASVFGAVWAAAKIFRIGVLMYGKAPNIRELATWVRRA